MFVVSLIVPGLGQEAQFLILDLSRAASKIFYV